MTMTLIETNNASEARMVAAIVTAFAADPVLRWLFPDAEQYLTHFPDFARAFAGKAFENGTADDLDEHSATALWLPPNVQPDEAAVMNVLQQSMSEPRLSEMFSVLEQAGSFHPNEPHWYLPLIGVDPIEQGRGCGSALLRKGLSRCDADRLPAYLESTNPRNVPLYESFGFKIVGRIKTKSSPVVIPMLRLAQ